MPYDLEMETHDDYISFKWAGPADYADIVDVWKRVAERCKSEGHWKVLVETHYQTYLSTMEIHEIASNFRALGFDSRFTIAHVFAGNEPKDMQRFGENVAVNRGANAKVFDNIESAKAWLLNEEKYSRRA